MGSFDRDMTEKCDSDGGSVQALGFDEGASWQVQRTTTRRVSRAGGTARELCLSQL